MWDIFEGLPQLNIQVYDEHIELGAGTTTTVVVVETLEESKLPEDILCESSIVINHIVTCLSAWALSHILSYHKQVGLVYSILYCW